MQMRSWFGEHLLDFDIAVAKIMARKERNCSLHHQNRFCENRKTRQQYCHKIANFIAGIMFRYNSRVFYISHQYKIVINTRVSFLVGALLYESGKELADTGWAVDRK